MKKFSILIFILLLTMTMTMGNYSAPAFTDTDVHDYILQFEDQDALSQDDVLRSTIGSEFKKIHLINGVAFKGSSKAIDALSKKMAIKHVEIDQIVTVLDKPAGLGKPTELGKPSGGSTPPAAQVTDWGIKAIKADQVWDQASGRGVNVAVIDTGIDLQHSDLSVVGGVSYVPRISSYDDDNGHGSHVAGIIAAKNNSIGTVGVAPNANLYAVKVLDKRGSGYLSNVILGIEWAVDHQMNVINMSLGSDSYSDAMFKALEKVKNAGIISVAAAGNDGGAVDFPGAYNNTLAIGALDASLNIAGFSSFGPELDFAAPGVKVYSEGKSNDYMTLSGTSMASPHVAGLAALYKEKSPGADLAAVKAALEASSQDLGDPGADIHYGAGLPDAVQLMQH